MVESHPKPNQIKKAIFLPRDIRLGLSRSMKKGTLLSGWCTNTDTYQLWELLEDGDDAPARFIGFIKPNW